MPHKLLAVAFVSLSLFCCGKQLSQVGDDCTKDANCASGLCDTNHSCADPVATTDGKPCTDDTNCPAGDHCDLSTAKCFSPAKDGTGGGAICSSNADCAGDETCVSGKCQG